MDRTQDHHPSDPFLDDAAAYAVGTQGASEAAEFNARLAAGTRAERQATAELQDVVARLAAASPYMAPAEDLRAGILAATAPASFKMEDYRRATDTRSSRYLWWGLAAACLCLVWSGYNEFALRQNNARLTAAVQRQVQQINQLGQQLDSHRIAMNALIDPSVHQINLRSPDQKIIGKMLVDSHKNVMIVMPDAVIPPNTKVRLAIQQNGQKMEVIADAVGAAPGSAFVHSTLPAAIDPNRPLDVQVNDRPVQATFGP